MKNLGRVVQRPHTSSNAMFSVPDLAIVAICVAFHDLCIQALPSRCLPLLHSSNICSVLQLVVASYVEHTQQRVVPLIL